MQGLLKPYKAMSGDLVYNRGEAGREVYIIISGRVQVDFLGESATEVASKRIVEAGTMFGEGCCSALFDLVDENDEEIVYTRETSAWAIEDCEMRFLTLSDMRDVCSMYPSVRTQMWLLVQGFSQARNDAQVKHWNAHSGSETTDEVVMVAGEFGKKITKRVRRRSILGKDQVLDGPKSPEPRLGSGRSFRGASTSFSRSATSGEPTDDLLHQMNSSLAKLEGRINKLEGTVDKKLESVLQSIARLEKQQKEPLLPNSAAP